MQNDDALNDDKKEPVSLYAVMTNDKYFADVVANVINARLFFRIVLPPQILDQLDMSTLRTMRARDVGADGIEKIGDVFFVVDMKERPGLVCRRAAFVIATEHKTKDEKYVPIQLLGYVSALLDVMSSDPETFADENGLLPTPYVVVFSQDARQKKQPAQLNDVLWTLPGLEGTVPNFEYQTVYASEIPLDVIRECEPAMRTFLYLMQIANKKHTDEEDAELAATFRRILEESPSDERLRQCACASINYFLHIQPKRPGMLTLPELRKEIEKQKGKPMENGILLFFEKEVTERCEQARQEGRQDGWQDGWQEGRQEGKQEGRQEGIYKTIYDNLNAKYGNNSVSERLKEKLDEINYYPALEEIQLAIWTTSSLDAFNVKLAKIVNKYEVEIQELPR